MFKDYIKASGQKGLMQNQTNINKSFKLSSPLRWTHLTIFALAFAGIGGFFLLSSHALGSPSPVPAANTNGVTVGPGFVRSSTRQVIRTSGNVVYIFAVDDDVCQGGGSAVLRAYKGSGSQTADTNVPTSFAEVDAAHHPVSTGSADCTSLNTSMLEDPDVKLDPSGIAHLSYIDENTSTVYYQTFSTLTDTWGSRTALATTGSTTSGASWPRTGQTTLTLDSNNVPWIVFATSGTSNSIQYTDKVGGNWSTPATIFSGTNEMHPSLATSQDGTLQLAWLDNSLASHAVIKYAHYSGGAWGAVETASSGDSIVLANGDDDQGPSIASDSQSRPYILYEDGTVNGSDNYVRLRYRTTGGTWTDNTPPGGSGGASNANGTWYAHTPGLYIANNNDVYPILGHDVNIEFGYQYQLGGPGNNWSVYTTLDPRSKTNPAPGDTCEPGQDGAASIRFDPLRDNNPGILDVAYYDERDNSDCTHHHATIFYKAVDIPTAGDTTSPTVSITAPTAGATVSGTTITSANASDNVAVASVQFKLDGSNLGSALTTSPYSLNWDTTTAANGSHSLTATACDTSNNCTTSSAISVTVSNGGAGPSIGDLNSDGHVDIIDLSILLSHYSQTGVTQAQGDINQDGTCNIVDLSILLSHYGT